MVSGNLLDHLAATDQLYGDSDIELGTVVTVLAHWWNGGSPDQGRRPASELIDEDKPEKPVHLTPRFRLKDQSDGGDSEPTEPS